MTSQSSIIQSAEALSFECFYTKAQEGQYFETSSQTFVHLSKIEKIFRNVMSYLCSCFNWVESYQEAALTRSLLAVKRHCDSLQKFNPQTDFIMDVKNPNINTDHKVLVQSIQQRCADLFKEMYPDHTEILHLTIHELSSPYKFVHHCSIGLYQGLDVLKRKIFPLNPKAVKLFRGKQELDEDNRNIQYYRLVYDELHAYISDQK